MSDLAPLEHTSVFVIREAVARLGRVAALWSVGKDSNVMLWLARKAFLGRVPFPVVQLDTGMELPEVYAFRDRVAKDWDLDLRVVPCPSEDETDPSLPPATRAAARKTEGLKRYLRSEGLTGVMVGIRRDEQGVRAKERVFSPRGPDGTWDVRDQPPEFWDHYATDPGPGGHVRIHPILQWSEIDVWRYTRAEGMPVVPLYLARDGLRYRSLGERNITRPVASEAATLDAVIAELEATREPERAGRTMDNETEDSFERLRAGGYL